MFEYLSDNITQGKLYEFTGKTDEVCTLYLLEGTDSYEKFGSSVTVVFIYTQKERRLLEENITGLDQEPNIKAKGLVFGEEKGKVKAEELVTDGIPVRDIVLAITLRSTLKNNTFGNSEKRSLNKIEINFRPYGKGKDIGWMYGFLSRQKKLGVGLMPEYEDIYTAYRFIIDKNEMSEEERLKVFDKDGHIVMSNVGYHYLMWGEEAGLLEEMDKVLLRELKQRKIHGRLEILKEELKKSGISFNQFRKKYSEQALFFLQKLFSFSDINFNTRGKFPLYMDYRSFVHIYMRHVDDVNMGEQLARRDKFQLFEEDVMYMIRHVMSELNDDYQKYKEINPDKRYCRKGDKAFYRNGDYYEVFVDEKGRLESLYKASRNKNYLQNFMKNNEMK